MRKILIAHGSRKALDGIGTYGGSAAVGRGRPVARLGRTAGLGTAHRPDHRGAAVAGAELVRGLAADLDSAVCGRWGNTGWWGRARVGALRPMP